MEIQRWGGGRQREAGEIAAAAVLQRVSEEKIIEQKILFDRFTLLDPRLQLLLLIQLKCVWVRVFSEHLQ